MRDIMTKGTVVITDVDRIKCSNFIELLKGRGVPVKGNINPLLDTDNYTIKLSRREDIRSTIISWEPINTVS